MYTRFVPFTLMVAIGCNTTPNPIVVNVPEQPAPIVDVVVDLPDHEHENDHTHEDTDPPVEEPQNGPMDGDGDGVLDTVDCDDTDPDVTVPSTEMCDGVDNDCDGIVDNNAVDRTTIYFDADGDGFGYDDPGATNQSCTPQNLPPGYVLNDDDCNDSHAGIFPGAADAPDDGVDSNCDGAVEQVPHPCDNPGVTLINQFVIGVDPPGGSGTLVIIGVLAGSDESLLLESVTFTLAGDDTGNTAHFDLIPDPVDYVDDCQLIDAWDTVIGYADVQPDATVTFSNLNESIYRDMLFNMRVQCNMHDVPVHNGDSDNFTAYIESIEDITISEFFTGQPVTESQTCLPAGLPNANLVSSLTIQPI